MRDAEEVWLDIPGFAGYQASSRGRIRSLDRVVRQAGKGGGLVSRRLAGRVLLPSRNRKGYLHVSVGSPAKTNPVAALVAAAFLGKPEPGHQVNHKDGRKENNTPGNLEYVTSTGNNHHALQTGLRSMKISDSQVSEIGRLLPLMSKRAIGRRFGIHHSYVGYLAAGRRVVTGVGATVGG